MNSLAPRTALLIDIGGTPNPVAYGIDHHRREKVIFFASKDSPGEIGTDPLLRDQAARVGLKTLAPQLPGQPCWRSPGHQPAEVAR